MAGTAVTPAVSAGAVHRDQGEAHGAADSWAPMQPGADDGAVPAKGVGEATARS